MASQASQADLHADIQRALVERYRDLTQPWYGWASAAYEADPYREVVDDLAALGAETLDETDLNDDVACRYSVSRDGVFLTTELSLVGPYAVVLDTRAEGSEPIVPGTPAPDLAHDVLTVLAARGLRVLDADTLRTPVIMPFQNIEAGRGTLYQALISDTPIPFNSHV